MQFEKPVYQGTIQKRYKRFLADITLDNGEEITAHTANTGSMKTCWEPGWKVLVTYHDDPKRKLKYSLEMTHNGKSWIGVNTSLPNKLSAQAIRDGKIKELDGYDFLKPEFKVGQSRIDILLYNAEKERPSAATEKCFVEIKNVTLKGETGLAEFPDSVSERGQKHLRELTQLVKEGHRACMLYIVQREDVDTFAPAESIDPTYAKLLREAADTGVEVLAYQCSLNEKGVEISKKLKIKL